MPAYEFRCRTCGDAFVVRRSMADSTTTAACPSGHTDTTRIFTPVAVGGRGGNGGAAPSPAPVAPPSAGGACCGGGCCG